jgi:hypothetical protein
MQSPSPATLGWSNSLDWLCEHYREIWLLILPPHAIDQIYVLRGKDFRKRFASIIEMALSRSGNLGERREN